ncbi:MAG TPA: alcohol dehydrogenase catalytic domain-containing protein [Candidatus Dormibacteraeota bacterium]|nr:alcohol dehydrogenase catalytic domain-containing protein [Candidatus Dormibacteraeota bacterium]
MKAVVLHAFGPPDVLSYEDWPDPGPPGPDEIVVRVGAVSVGRLLDLGTRAGTNRYFRGQLPHILGSEHAGIVVEVGRDVHHLQVGDRVAVFSSVSCGRCRFCEEGREDACPETELIGVHRPGADAELVQVPASMATVIPKDLPFTVAAAMALTGPVAWTQLDMAGLCPGDWVLINGAASGLGSMTAVVARHLGARVIGTSRKAWKRAFLLELGLEAALDATAPGFEEEVRELTGGAGVQIVVENIGSAEAWPHLLGALARRGTVISSGAFIGDRLPLDLRSLYQQSQRVIGVRTATKRGVAAFWREVAPHVRPVLDRTFPLAEAAAAHRHLESSDNLGRVVLVPTEKAG